MNVFLFGIGGTGARVLRSLTYCIAADMGDLPAGVNFVPMIIDHDITNKDKKIAIDTLEKYRKIQRAAHPEGFNPNEGFRSFFLPGIKYLADIHLGDGGIVPNFPKSFEFKFGIGRQQDDNGTFAEYIGLNALNGPLALTGDLLKSIYNDSPAYIQDKNRVPQENPLAELNLDLGKGYRGNPNIGTVVFDSIEETNAYKYFTQNFNPANDIVVIVGSIFGGTGSSGIPKLIEAIRSNHAHGWNAAKVACIMVMPYFKVNTPDANSGIAPAIHDNIFKSKQKAALSFYDSCKIGAMSMNNAFDSIYYIADEDSRQHRNEYSEGGDTQENFANIVELIAAIGIVDFTRKVYEGNAVNHYNEYGLEIEAQSQHSLWLKNFCQRDQATSLKSLTRLTLALKHYRDHIMPGRPNNAATYYGENGLKIAANIHNGIYKDLTDFTKKFEEWLDQLEKIHHSFAPYDFKNASDLNTVVRGYNSSSGGIFNHNGVSYKDFDSMASTSWAGGVRTMENKNCAFIKVLYDAAKGQADNAVRKPVKNK